MKLSIFKLVHIPAMRAVEFSGSGSRRDEIGASRLNK